MIQLYTSPTPNGWKASVALEELELSYEVTAIDLSKNVQKRVRRERAQVTADLIETRAELQTIVMPPSTTSVDPVT